MSILSKLKQRKHQKLGNALSLRSPEEIDALTERLDAVRAWKKSLSPEERKEIELRIAEARKTDPIFGGMPRVGENPLQNKPRMSNSGVAVPKLAL